MNLQYISDSKGKTTGVFIPINEWKKLIKIFKGIDIENVDIPAWHIKEVRRRLKEFEEHPENGVDFDQAMDAIEKQL